MNATEPIVRPAEISDIDQIVSLWTESFQYHRNLDHRLEVRSDAGEKIYEFYREQIEKEDAYVVIACDSESVIAYTCAILVKRPPIHKESQSGFIDGLYVKPMYRRQGLGRKLVDVALTWLKEHDVKSVQLNVASENPLGISFWKSIGFSEFMMRMDFRF